MPTKAELETENADLRARLGGTATCDDHCPHGDLYGLCPGETQGAAGQPDTTIPCVCAEHS